MSIIELCMVAIVPVALFSVLALLWRSIARINEALDSFGSFEGMHFNDLSPRAQANAGFVALDRVP